MAGGARTHIDWLLREGAAEAAVRVSERIVFNDDHWRATIERLDVSAGIRVYLTRAEVRRPLTLEPRQQDDDLWLMGHVAVKGRVSVALADGQSVELGPERAALYRPADRRATFTPAPGRSLRLVSYMVRADRLRHIFGEPLPDLLQPLMRETFATSDVLAISVGPPVARLVASLFASPLQGPLRDIFVEGVVLQLLAMKTAQAAAHAIPGAPSETESARLEEARGRLLADMRNPPNAGDLAIAAGMSETALNAGFRALFGGTVFEVLRDERLEHARIAIETTDRPIKQIAHGVGYGHVTNFINAFTRRYGKPPVRYMRERAGEVRSA
jgi:AraC-like DNA-binding protein